MDPETEPGMIFYHDPHTQKLRHRKPYKILMCAFLAFFITFMFMTVYIGWIEASPSIRECSEQFNFDDLNIWANISIPKEHVQLAIDRSFRPLGSNDGLSLVEIKNGRAKVIAGWGKNWFHNTHIAEKALFRFGRKFGLNIGRPDTLKTLTEFVGFDTGGKTIRILINDRDDDHPVVDTPESCPYIEDRDFNQSGLWLPVMSVAKIPGCSADILIPFRDLFTYSTKLETLPFEERINNAVWRGSLTGPAQQNSTVPHIRKYMVNVTRDREDSNVKHSKQKDFISMSRAEQLQYKIVLDGDGHSYSKRLKWFWEDGKSVVMHGGFYTDVLLRKATPGVNYWEFNMTNLPERLDTILGNELLAKKIQRGGALFGKKYTNNEVWRCYVKQLVERYASLNIRLDY